MNKSSKKIKIFLIEDNRLLRDGIYALLKEQSDMDVVATASNGESILAMIQKFNPEIVLLDLGLRDRNSLQLVKLIKKNYSDIMIIVMDFVPLQSDIYNFVKAGVSGFMLKDINVTEFLKTIRSVYAGSKILPPNLTGSLFSEIVENALNDTQNKKINNAVRMTKREKQVIAHISDGCTNKEIAQKLHLSTYTVKSHVHNILEKLALNTRLQIAKHAHFSSDLNNAQETTPQIDE